jgi:dUTP pyrophosphatase
MEIKTISHYAVNRTAFDDDVNKALADGWYLERRYSVVEGGGQTVRLIADLVKYTEKKTVTIPIKFFDSAVMKIEKIDVGDWIDLKSAEDVTLKANEYKRIRLGVAMALPHGYEAHVLCRSSTPEKFGIICANSMGVIDNSYSGDSDEWQFPAVALRDTVIRKGDRIAQFRIMRNQPNIEFKVVDKLSDHSRGGFGSTGKR